MYDGNTSNSEKPVLLQELFRLITVHRSAFQQERPYQRSVGLVLAELMSFGRHTVTQDLLTLGLTQVDWNAFYRLFSRPRFDEAQLSHCLFTQTVDLVPEHEPYVVGVDGTQVPRASRKMPGTSWLKAPRTPVFKVGIHRAQRFLHGAWLTPMEAGYSRAVPLRFLPAFPPKAVPALAPVRKEWEAGLEYLAWVRGELDQAGRSAQWLLALADGAFDTLGMWRGLPARTALVVRTAKNRALYELPGDYAGRGRPASYGARAPTPNDWLHNHRPRWENHTVAVRGKQIQMRCTVQGPFLREDLPEVPLFLLVVKGMHRKVGKRKVAYKHKGPSYYLISAVWRDGRWQLPFPLELILAWLWQRWELEVAHREMKSGFGIGHKQCWHPRSAVRSVQWSVWVYALFLLAGIRTWGLLAPPRAPTRWWSGAPRWLLNSLWREFRALFFHTPDFRPLWFGSPVNWPEKEAHLAALANATLAATRI